MERKWFSWESWDDLGALDFQYHDCILLRAIGENEIGSKFSHISVFYSTGILELSLDDTGENIQQFSFDWSIF